MTSVWATSGLALMPEGTAGVAAGDGGAGADEVPLAVATVVGPDALGLVPAHPVSTATSRSGTRAAEEGRTP